MACIYGGTSIQDNRILAQLEQPRTTGPTLPGLKTSLGASIAATLATGITASSMMPSSYLTSYATAATTLTSGINSGRTGGISSGINSGLGGITGGINALGISSSTSHHALTSNIDPLTGGLTGNSTGIGGGLAHATGLHGSVSQTFRYLCYNNNYCRNYSGETDTCLDTRAKKQESGGKLIL